MNKIHLNVTTELTVYILCFLNQFCDVFVFVFLMRLSVRWGHTGKAQEKNQSIIFTGATDSRHGTSHRATWEKPSVIRKQETGAKGKD